MPGLFERSGCLRRQDRAHQCQQSVRQRTRLFNLSRCATGERGQLAGFALPAGPATHDLDIYRHTTQSVP